MPLAILTPAATDNQRPSSSHNVPDSTSSTPAIDSNALNENKKKRGRHKPRNREGVDRIAGNEPDNTSASQPHGNDHQPPQDPTAQGRRGPRRRRPAANVANQLSQNDSVGNTAAHSGRSTPHTTGTGDGGTALQNEGASGSSAPRAVPRGGGRRRNINAKLTEESTDSRQVQDKFDSKPSVAPRRAREREPKADNLTNRLIDSLKTPPYADCPICFNSIHPAQPIWSCTPDSHRSPAYVDDSGNSPGDAQCCYTPFHLKCIISWASKSVKDLKDAYRARGEHDKQGEWRCPGCQRRRRHVPQSYLCFCGQTSDPRPARLATPHSCGNPCSRIRTCGHSCPLACHPGPCPPCQITTQLPCHCGRQTKTFRCADLTALSANAKNSVGSVSLSCGQICDKPLGCGRHTCKSLCHPDVCSECPIVEEARCYCGKVSKQLKCGEGEEIHSAVVNGDGVLEEWDGRFVCENTCDRLFDCGVHKCEKPCHTPSTNPSACPRSPSLVSHCPCGKRLLSDLEGGARQKCTDPILTCGSLCMKVLVGCDHVCSIPCHNGLCPPCSIPVVIPCRCGSTTRSVPCSQTTSSLEPLEILCDKPCTALRACGRHQCNRLCCPLASLSAALKGKGKKRAQHVQSQLGSNLESVLGEEAHWHECDLACGRPLGCGNHFCEERDHRGACPPCLCSSFEEMICHCGRTIIEPPVPCGTRISCSYPCSRPPPPCGHPKSPHSCHEDATPCPPCPFLASKVCACGKKTIGNVRCSQEKVSCGTACGKSLDCGFHHCERLCHSGDCGSCTSICGKSRKLCLPAHHGCPNPCHAPATCSEDEPCQATVTLKCPCGRIQQPSLCGRCTSNPLGREATQQPKCTNECAIAKRNARLAEALGISQEVKERDGQKPVVYSDDLIAFTRANPKFCTLVEKSFDDFITSEKKSQVLPYMPEARRKFVHDLAAVYRMDTQMVDQEPHRSVQLIRRIDTRIPKPLLSAAAMTNNLGRLADFRHSSSPSPAPRPVAHTTPAIGAPLGWRSVVAQSGSQTRAPTSAWGTNARSTAASTASATSSRTSSSRLVQLNRTAVIPPVTPTTAGPVPDSWENDEI